MFVLAVKFGLDRAVCGLCSGEIMVGPEGERWLTYAEVGQLLGISAAAARMLAKRRDWPRRTPNMYADRARVLVPDDPAVQPRSAPYAEPSAHVSTSDREGPNGRDQANVRVFEQAITALQEQLERERSRVDRAESHLEEARGRLDQLQAALGDAIAAERIAAGEASALRAELDHHRKRAARPWWRRR
jgi:hypothetical protein